MTSEVEDIFQPMKRLLLATAGIELGAGAALLAVPSLAVKLLFDSPLEAPAAVMLGRLAGAALLALGVACWLSRADESSRAARGLTAAMLLYNFSAVVILAIAGLGPKTEGILLWPAVILHVLMTGWCIACLRHWPAAQSSKTQNPKPHH
jgi:hypothetical protein